MYKILIFPVILIILLDQSSQGNKIDSDDNFIIYSDTIVGPWKVGSENSEFFKNLPASWSYTIDSLDACEACFEFYDIYKVYFNDKPLLDVEPDWEAKGNLFRFSVYSDLFETEKAFKIGMTVAELKKLYEVTDIVTGEDIGIAIMVKGFQGSFKVPWQPRLVHKKRSAHKVIIL